MACVRIGAVEGDRIDADLQHLGGVLTFGRIEILTVDRDGAVCAGRHRVLDMSDLGTRGAVRSLPVDPVTDLAAAAAFAAALAVDAECDSEFILAQAHDEGIVGQDHGLFGQGGRGAARVARRAESGQTDQGFRGGLQSKYAGWVHGFTLTARHGRYKRGIMTAAAEFIMRRCHMNCGNQLQANGCRVGSRKYPLTNPAVSPSDTNRVRMSAKPGRRLNCERFER